MWVRAGRKPGLVLCPGNKGPSFCRVGFLRDTPNSHSKFLLPARRLSPLCTAWKLRLGALKPGSGVSWWDPAGTSSSQDAAPWDVPRSQRCPTQRDLEPLAPSDGPGWGLWLIPLSLFPDPCLCRADLAQEAVCPSLAHPLALVPPPRVAHSPGRPPCLLSGGVASASITRLLDPPCALELSPFSPPQGSVYQSGGIHSQANVLQLPHPTWSHRQLGQSSCVTSCPRLPGRGSCSPWGQHLHGVTAPGQGTAGCPQQLVALPKPGKLQETLGCLG